jgi:hypothetical protein
MLASFAVDYYNIARTLESQICKNMVNFVLAWCRNTFLRKFKHTHGQNYVNNFYGFLCAVLSTKNNHLTFL